MQDRLYPLSTKDIEAIGKSRASRSLPQNVNWWLYGGAILCIGGFSYSAMGGNIWFVMGMVVAGAVGVCYSAILLDRIRKNIIRQLKQDWRDEDKVGE